MTFAPEVYIVTITKLKRATETQHAQREVDIVRVLIALLTAAVFTGCVTVTLSTGTSESTTLPAGIYVVGRDEGPPPPGRYTVTSIENLRHLKVWDSEGKVKVFELLRRRDADTLDGVPSWTFDLEDGDKIELNFTAIFTPTD